MRAVSPPRPSVQEGHSPVFDGNAPASRLDLAQLTRRGLLASLGSAGMLAGYALQVEPHWRLRLRHYAVTPPTWPSGHRLTIAALADLHAYEPSLSLDRAADIVEATNVLKPDLVVLLGDYSVAARHPSRVYAPSDIAGVLAGLQAPLGVFAIAGNHDWWIDDAAMLSRRGLPAGLRALAARGIQVLANAAVPLALPGGRSAWLIGLDSQWAFGAGYGADNLSDALRQVTDDAPAILLAHEPDIFPEVPGRIAVTLSGHTHGGQVRLFGWSPWIPSRYGNRYAYGHVVAGNRHLIVSGGLGTSVYPVRLGVPPEIVLVKLGHGLPRNYVATTPTAI
jgi:uncharacterized protein